MPLHEGTQRPCVRDQAPHTAPIRCFLRSGRSHRRVGRNGSPSGLSNACIAERKLGSLASCGQVRGEIGRRGIPGSELEQCIRLELERVKFGAHSRVLLAQFACRLPLKPDVEHRFSEDIIALLIYKKSAQPLLNERG